MNKKTFGDYEREGWTLIEYGDHAGDIIVKFEKMLEPHGLKVEWCEDLTDGYEPIRIVKDEQKN